MTTMTCALCRWDAEVTRFTDRDAFLVECPACGECTLLPRSSLRLCAA